ncbi:MAG: hypothetical protein AB8B63_22850, partial [Granulosicoccus sp.]
TLASLSCSAGDVAKFIAGQWTCAADDFTNTDTLAELVCAVGHIIVFNNGWRCARASTIDNMFDVFESLEMMFCVDGENLTIGEQDRVIRCETPNVQSSCPVAGFLDARGYTEPSKRSVIQNTTAVCEVSVIEGLLYIFPLESPPRDGGPARVDARNNLTGERTVKETIPLEEARACALLVGCSNLGGR